MYFEWRGTEESLYWKRARVNQTSPESLKEMSERVEGVDGSHFEIISTIYIRKLYDKSRFRATKV